MNKKGLTLIELIIVFVIIGITAALMTPSIGTWIQNYRLRTAARDVVSIMRTAQMKAVSTNMQHGVGFDTNLIQLYRTSGGLILEGSPIILPAGVQFNNNTFPINATLNKRYVEFNMNSSASSGGVTLRNTKGSEKRITVLSATGRINVN